MPSGMESRKCNGCIWLEDMGAGLSVLCMGQFPDPGRAIGGRVACDQPSSLATHPLP